MKFSRYISNFLNYILNIIFPLKCVFCRERLSLFSLDNICNNCLNNLPYCLSLHRCKVCGKPLEPPSDVCEFCLTHPNHYYKKISSAYLYKGHVRNALLRFKHYTYKNYSKIFAIHMKGVIENDFKNISFDYIVSVPPRIKRIRETGYDQSRQLAMALSQQINIPYLPRAMKQLQVRKRQSDLPRESRIENTKGNFKVIKSKIIKDKNILLIDDICTSRSTLLECSNQLILAGAKSVYCATAATTS